MDNGQHGQSSNNQDLFASGITSGVGTRPETENPLPQKDNLNTEGFFAQSRDYGTMGNRALDLAAEMPLPPSEDASSVNLPPKSTVSTSSDRGILGEVIDLPSPPTLSPVHQESAATDAQTELDQATDRIARDGKVTPLEAKTIETEFLPEFNTNPADAYENFRTLRKKLAQAAMKGAA